MVRQKDGMDPYPGHRRWVWTTLILSSVTVIAVVFAGWELLENAFFRDTDYVTLHYLYVTRGVASSFLLAIWAGWYVLRQRQRSEEEISRSRERYRGLLEISPGAVALYDTALQVVEWNTTSERLYSFSKGEVLGHRLPTIPPDKEDELQRFLEQVAGGEPVMDVETLRRDKGGVTFEVQLSLLPFREADGQSYFLEVTEDIRERARLRQKMLDIEKLTSMGQMAAGTAHHLNSPLAAMLLRVQMVQQRTSPEPYEADLERLEAGLRTCQYFVQRLLQFSRRNPVQKLPQDVSHTIESVVSFLDPSLSSKHVHLSLDLDLGQGQQILADRNQLEALFSMLLTNALDAVPPEGTIVIRCCQRAVERIEIQISDNGCGIVAADLPHVFEPFFTTKRPGEGTGLGLAIARNIVLEHGGSIRLDSKPGQGTTAFVEFPLYQPPSGESGASHENDQHHALVRNPGGR